MVHEEYMPVISIDQERSYVQCENSVVGHLTYMFSKNSIYMYEDTPSSYDINRFKEICGKEKYTIYLAHKTDGTWFEYSFALIGTLLGILAVFRIIKTLFFYVISGERFWTTLFSIKQ